VNLHTSTGWGSVTHWNGFVANLEMHGKGTFFDPRLGYYHDGRFAKLSDVVDHYGGRLGLGLTAGQKSDLVEYLKSL
jgi:hypothetical protein